MIFGVGFLVCFVSVCGCVQAQPHNYHIIDPLDTIYKLSNYFASTQKYIYTKNEQSEIIARCLLFSALVSFLIFLSFFCKCTTRCFCFSLKCFFLLLFRLCIHPRCAQFSDILLATKKKLCQIG